MKTRAWIVGGATLILLAGVWLTWWLYSQYSDEAQVRQAQEEERIRRLSQVLDRAEEFGEPVSPDQLPGTEMLPFDSAEIVGDKNMVYCPTFVLAWNEFRKFTSSKTPPTDFARKIEAVQFSIGDIDPDHVRTVTGSYNPTRLEEARQEVGVKSPLSVLSDEVDFKNVAYCVLSKNLPFRQEFERFSEPLSFFDGQKKVDVRAFGVTSDWHHWGNALAQVDVLDYRSPDDFVIRINNLGEDDLILAKMPQPATLQEGVRQVESRIKNTHLKEDATSMTDGEQLVIPIVEMNLLANFTGGIYNSNHSAGRRIVYAAQQIQFRLNEQGARLRSAAIVQMDNGHYEYKVGERTFIFDQHFMILLRESSDHPPYFAAWIGNTELMTPVTEEAPSD